MSNLVEIVLYVLLPLLIIFWLTSTWVHRKSLPPGPINLPILGYLPFLDQKAPHETLTQLSQRYGPIYGLYLGSVYTVVLSDSKLIRQAFAKDSLTGRAPLYVTHGIMKGYGLICAEGELWKDQRKFVVNFLKNFGIVKYGEKRDKIEELIKSQVLDLIEYLKNETCPTDPLQSLRHYLGSAVNILVFGKSWSKDDATWLWLQDLQEEGTKRIGVAGPLNFLPLLRCLPMFTKTMDFLISGKIETHKFYQTLIDEIAKSNKSIEKPDDCSNLIEAFLYERNIRKNDTSTSSDNFYCDQQFYHLLADVFGAGLDTTLTTLRWFLLYMAAYPHEQRKVQSELDDVLKGAFPDLQYYSHLTLTEAAICEAQRIRSVVPLGIPHGAVEEIQLFGYRVPKGTMVVPLQWAIHMDPKLWENPNVYNPGRFLDPDGRVIRPEHFIPFQTGKRICVGDQLAKMLLFLFCAGILQKFFVSLEDETDLNLIGDCGITLTPKEHRLVFKLRSV